MKSKQVRDILLKEIHSVCKSIDQFCVSPGKDFVRSRKIPIEKLILAIIGMGNRSITNELLEFYDVSPNTPTASAFVQQRDKLKPECNRQVLFPKFRHLIFPNPRHLRFHSQRHFIFHTCLYSWAAA